MSISFSTSMIGERMPRCVRGAMSDRPSTRSEFALVQESPKKYCAYNLSTEKIMGRNLQKQMECSSSESFLPGDFTLTTYLVNADICSDDLLLLIMAESPPTVCTKTHAACHVVQVQYTCTLPDMSMCEEVLRGSSEDMMWSLSLLGTSVSR